MEIRKVIPSGYCKGVILALRKVKETVNKYPDQKIYCLGMIVHNRYVVEAFNKMGVITLEDKTKTKAQLIDEINEGVVIFTAHGIDPALKKKASDKGLIVVDATCEDVEKNASLVKEYLNNDYDVLYIGKKNHPESDAVLALSSRVHLISYFNDIDDINLTNEKILITNQTTMSSNDIAKTIEQLLKKYPNAKVAEEICAATRLRQNAVKNLKDVDLLIVVGDPSSNNTAQLANIGKDSGIAEIIKIESAVDLKNYDLKDSLKVAITAGASTPTYLTNQVIEYLKTKDEKYCTIDINMIIDN